jgi:hypothetical protein
LTKVKSKLVKILSFADRPCFSFNSFMRNSFSCSSITLNPRQSLGILSTLGFIIQFKQKLCIVPIHKDSLLMRMT